VLFPTRAGVHQRPFWATPRLPAHPADLWSQKGTHAGILDKAKDKAKHLIGEAKEKIGQMTGNENLENAGKRDQLIGETKEAVGMVRQ
jgi:uncharacterized protein YjbJ (UPF0337 family)